MGKAPTTHQNRLLNAADVTEDGKEFGNNRTFAELCLIPQCDCVYTPPLADAGWSSLAARRAHNPKVGGSNPPPATNSLGGPKTSQSPDECTALVGLALIIRAKVGGSNPPPATNVPSYIRTLTVDLANSVNRLHQTSNFGRRIVKGDVSISVAEKHFPCFE